MQKISSTVVFFGSGPVAAKSLELLAQSFDIEGVVTKPRAPHHKGNVPVISVAESLQIPIYMATDKKSLDKLFQTKPFKSPAAVLVDFGIIVSQLIIDYFPRGIVNSHFSLLPEWRGPDPITFSILSGQKQTGVSLMLLTSGMDEGPLLAQSPCTIPENATTPSLTESLIEISDWSLKKILPLWLDGRTEVAPQQAATMAASAEPSYSRKLSKEDGLLIWKKPAEVLEREIRAFIEWPKSRTQFHGLEVIITKASVINRQGKPGGHAIINKGPVVFCGVDALTIQRLKPAGKQEMSGKAFLAGYKELFLAQ